MYEDEGGDLPPAMPGGGLRSKLGYHFEGLIPLILIILIGVVAAGALGIIDIPFITKTGPIRMLVIGSPSHGVIAILDEDKDLVQYNVRSAYSLTASPNEQLAQYDIVMLDQTGQSDKFLPRQVGEALREYVKKGGKLIVVGNSGIYRKDSPGIIGWKANLGDVVPVECVRDREGVPSCTKQISVTGELWRTDFDHPVMQGIEVIPADPKMSKINFKTFAVAPIGNEIAFIQNVRKADYYTGIVEKRLLLGKCVYFNYDPALTRGVFEKTLEYLR